MIQLKKLASDFRSIAARVWKDNENKTKIINETLQILTACKKEFQKLHLKHEELKKKFLKKKQRDTQTLN